MLHIPVSFNSNFLATHSPPLELHAQTKIDRQIHLAETNWISIYNKFTFLVLFIVKLARLAAITLWRTGEGLRVNAIYSIKEVSPSKSICTREQKLFCNISLYKSMTQVPTGCILGIFQFKSKVAEHLCHFAVKSVLQQLCHCFWMSFRICISNLWASGWILCVSS